MLSKNVNNKKYALNLYFSMKKKPRKILMIFDIDFESIFWHFPLHQFPECNSFLWVRWFLAKTLASPKPF